MTPGELLSVQREMYEYLGHPAAETSQFLDELYSAFEQGSVPGDVIRDPAQARFARATWVSWFYPVDRGRDLLPLLRKSLYATPAYQVSEVIVDAVTAMYRKTSEVQTVRFTEADLPSPSGFLWLDKPVMLTDIGGEMKSSRAFSWSPVNVLSEETSVTGLGIRFTVWNLPSDPNGTAMTSLPGAPLDLVSSQITPFGRDLQRLNLTLQGGKLMPGTSKTATDDVLYWMQTLWMFMGTEIVRPEKAVIPRYPERRKAERSVGNGTVNVVLLRRMRQGEREVGHRDVDWTCQWVVQAFWRHLESYAGAADPHQAKVTGAEKVCAVCGARVTHVRAHVRGPAGLPLKAVPETVYRVSR